MNILKLLTVALLFLKFVECACNNDSTDLGNGYILYNETRMVDKHISRADKSLDSISSSILFPQIEDLNYNKKYIIIKQNFKHYHNVIEVPDMVSYIHLIEIGKTYYWIIDKDENIAYFARTKEIFDSECARLGVNLEFYGYKY